MVAKAGDFDARKLADLQDIQTGFELNWGSVNNGAGHNRLLWALGAARDEKKIEVTGWTKGTGSADYGMTWSKAATRQPVARKSWARLEDAPRSTGGSS